MKKTKQQISVYWSQIKKAFAVLTGHFEYLNLKETRECFNEATHFQRKFLRLEMFTEKWESCFEQWLELCVTKEQCMDTFFTVFSYRYLDEDGEWTPNPLKEMAAMKWLSLISKGSITVKDEDHVWKLSGNHWGQGRTPSYWVAHKLRDQIALSKANETCDSNKLYLACHYASSETVGLYILEKIKSMQSSKTS